MCSEAAYKGKPPTFAGEVVSSHSGNRGGSFSRSRSANCADASAAAASAGASGSGLPPTKGRSGSWKGRKQESDDQYESVVVRTATGDKMVLRLPIQAAANGPSNGLPPRSPGSGSSSGRMRKGVEHSQADADAATAAAAAGSSSRSQGLPPRRPSYSKASNGASGGGGGGGGLFRKMISRKVHKEAARSAAGGQSGAAAAQQLPSPLAPAPAAVAV